MVKLRDLMEKQTPFSKITTAFETMEFSMHVMRSSNYEDREHWIASELAQVLRVAFANHRSSTVWINTEYPRVKPDLNITGRFEGTNRAYPIEIKRANQKDALKDLSKQLHDQRRYIPDFTSGFVFLFAENSQNPLEDDEIKDYLEYAQNDDDFYIYTKNVDDVKQKMD